MIRLGQRLHEVRMQKKLTLEDVAKATKIRPKFLTSIEKGEYEKLPSPAYIQGFVSNYAEYLGLSKRETLALFRREFDEKQAYKVLPDGFSKTKEFPINRIKVQRSIFLVIGVLILLMAYLLYQNRFVYFPPILDITAPKQNQTITSDNITIMGKTDPNATVTVNTDPASIDSKGEFNKTITVFPGKSTITIKARNRIGKETTVTRNIVVK